MAPVVVESAAPAAAVPEITVKKVVKASGPTLRKRRSRGSRTSSTASSSAASDATSGTDASLDQTFGNAEPTESIYLWGCELTRSKDTHVAKYPVHADTEDEASEDEGADETEYHQLILKGATLGADARDDERNVVAVHFTNMAGEEERRTLASLTTGVTDTVRLDLTMSWSKGHNLTFKLIKGSGPVTLLGNHIVSSLVAEDEDADDSLFVPDGVSTETEESGMSTDGDEMDASEVKDLEADKEKPLDK